MEEFYFSVTEKIIKKYYEIELLDKSDKHTVKFEDLVINNRTVFYQSKNLSNDIINWIIDFKEYRREFFLVECKIKKQFLGKRKFPSLFFAIVTP